MEVKEYFEQDLNDVIFDFTNDVLEDKKVSGKYKKLKEEYLNGVDPLEKYIMYKTVFKIDPDSNEGLLKDIYQKIWDDKILEYCISNDKIKYYSDTMTSAQNLLSNYYMSSCSEEWDKYKAKEKVKNFSIKIFDKMLKNKDKYPQFKEAFSKKNVVEFIKYYHTLGNYIPVPKGFNVARSGIFASHDMWDITLEKIKQYYDTKQKSNNFSESLEIILELLHMKDTIKSTINWLDKFGSWENFVEQNFLKEENGHRNYVDEKYNINKLAKHNFSKPKLEKEEYLNYFGALTEIIKGRTLIIQEHYKTKFEK